MFRDVIGELRELADKLNDETTAQAVLATADELEAIARGLAALTERVGRLEHEVLPREVA